MAHRGRWAWAGRWGPREEVTHSSARQGDGPPRGAGPTLAKAEGHAAWARHGGHIKDAERPRLLRDIDQGHSHLGGCSGRLSITGDHGTQRALKGSERSRRV